MKRKTALLIFALLTALLSSGLCGAVERRGEPQPIVSRWSLSVGHEEARDNYLSTVRFSGTAWGLSGEWEKMFPWSPEKLGMRFDADLGFGSMLNGGMTQRLYDLGADLGWGMFAKWNPAHPWSLKLGGRVGAGAGLLYLPSNGNNPVSARGAVDLSLAGSASYKFKIKGIRLVVSDSFRLPLAGVFFSPEYGESYYEIYLGNRQGLAHFGWPGNRFCVDNRLTVGCPVGRYSIELGYRIDYRSQRVNNLTTRIARHFFTVGVSF